MKHMSRVFANKIQLVKQRFIWGPNLRTEISNFWASADQKTLEYQNFLRLEKHFHIKINNTDFTLHVLKTQKRFLKLRAWIPID